MFPALRSIVDPGPLAAGRRGTAGFHALGVGARREAGQAAQRRSLPPLRGRDLDRAAVGPRAADLAPVAATPQWPAFLAGYRTVRPFGGPDLAALPGTPNRPSAASGG